ncbi:MAG: 4Fe-4S binding protein, partial [Anaerolineales bacterium]|nr:4Fe-4S binding protein [Anaerolineales bacterium]
MSVYAKPAVTGQGTIAGARSFLRRMLEGQSVSSVLVDVAAEGQGIPHRRLVHDPEQLEHSLPFAPAILASGARLAAQLTERRAMQAGGRPAGKRPCAIVMRPCEARAAVELSKLRQVDLSQVLIIAVDCVGTHEAAAFGGLEMPGVEWAERYTESLRRGGADSPVPLPYRRACTRCVDAVAPVADIWLHVIGVPEAEEILVEVRDPELAERLELGAVDDVPERGVVLAQLKAQRESKRQLELDAALQALQPGADGRPGLTGQFDTCLRCLNCGTACPLCYCKECLFRTDSLRVECRHLFDLAERRGAVRLPGDAILYQLTRLIHVSTSCVGCGLCSSACPMDLPVDLVFQSVGRETQAL